MLLFNLFEDESNELNISQKEALNHLIYWHHAKPYRKDNKFNGVVDAYEYLKKNIKPLSFVEILNQVFIQLEELEKIVNRYPMDFEISKILNWKKQDLVLLIEKFISRYENLPFPSFKHYRASDDFPELRLKIKKNAYHNLLRSCLVSADRLVSSLSAFDLSDLIKEHRLSEVLVDTQEVNSSLSSYISQGLAIFPNSEQTLKQKNVAKILSEKPYVGVLAGAAGCGKTKIALEWAQLNQAQQIIWICPRVQICQGIFQELVEYYLPDATIEILTGEFQFTSRWDNITNENKYFTGDVVVTTIDQVLGSIITHTKVNTLISFMNAHVIFDEYHEYIPMSNFNLLFAELVANKFMREDFDKRILLVSATPHYSYLDNLFSDDFKYDVVEMPSFNQSQYQLEFIMYDEKDVNTNPFYQPYDNKTFIISNTAQTAQLGFLYQKEHENNVLFHSKFKRSDKKMIFNEVYESFKHSGNQKYNVLRSGPIVQASLNISCDDMLTEMSSPENILQRLGRLDRFGENKKVNLLKVAITAGVQEGKRKDASSYFLSSLSQLQSAKAWYCFLIDKLDGIKFTLPELYNLYKEFYQSEYKKLLEQDLRDTIKKTIESLNKKVTEPINISTLSTNSSKSKISKNSLRGDSRFIQLAILDVNDYKNPLFMNQYAYNQPIDDLEQFDNLTESLSFLKDLGLIDFIAKKHGRIDVTHPIYGIPEKKHTIRCAVLEHYARNPEYPLYVSYIEDDLNQIGGTPTRNDEAIYYAICDKQPVGILSLKTVQTLYVRFPRVVYSIKRKYCNEHA